MNGAVRVTRAATTQDWAEADRLIRAYLAELPFEVDFQDVDRELAELPLEYGPPNGVALLARTAEPSPDAAGAGAGASAAGPAIGAAAPAVGTAPAAAVGTAPAAAVGAAPAPGGAGGGDAGPAVGGAAAGAAAGGAATGAAVGAAAGPAIGFVGVRRFGSEAAGDAELKRMFVVPEGRGTGAGRALAEAAVAAARELGYRRLLLDTVAWMTTAISIYESLGFEPTGPYRHNPLPDARYFALDLTP